MTTSDRIAAFMRECRRRAGTNRALAGIATAGTGRSYSPSAASFWAKPPTDVQGRPTKTNLPPSDVVAAMLEAFPDLSFDRYVRGEAVEVTETAAEQITGLQEFTAEQRRVNALLFGLIRALNSRTGAGLDLNLDLAGVAAGEPAIQRLLDELGIARPA